MTDPITDMLNRIRNAQDVFQAKTDVPFSNLKYEIAKILEKRNFIGKIEKKGKKSKKFIEINLKYKDKSPAISGLKRISKPGQRNYIQAKNIKKIRGGYGMYIISTPKGLMTDQEAKRQGLGGEILCEVW